MFRFENIDALYLLFLLIPLGGLFVWFMLGREKALKQMGEGSLIARLIPEKPSYKHQVKFGLVALAVMSLIFALAKPQWSTKTEPVTRSGVDFMVALDISNSMLAEDEKPSRLERSRQFISQLVSKLRGDRVGLIIFAGNAYLQVPLTSDYVATRSLLRTVSPRLAPTQGTAIGEAIKLADKAFESGEKQYKALLIISDGENHEGEAMEAAREAANNGVRILTMGVGSTSGAPIPVYAGSRESDYKRDREGNIVFSKLNEQMLQEVALAGGGRYFRLSTGEDVNVILSELAGMEKKDFEEVIFTDYEDQYQWFLALALMLLVMEYFISERRSKLFSDWGIFK